MRIRFAVLGVVLFAASASVPAEVLDSSAQGFTTRNSANIAAPPRRVYDTLVKQVGKWWNPQHSWSGDATNLSIDARAGGCFCEKIGDEGGAVHATVIQADPGKTLRLSGGLGPLQEHAVAGSLTFTFEPEGEGTRVVLIYRVGGYIPANLKGIDAGVDFVMNEQLQRLKAFVETGKPVAP